LIADWGHLTASDFAKKAVWQVSHPEFQQFLCILKNPLFQDPIVNLGSLATYVKMAKNLDQQITNPEVVV